MSHLNRTLYTTIDNTLIVNELVLSLNKLIDNDQPIYLVVNEKGGITVSSANLSQQRDVATALVIHIEHTFNMAVLLTFTDDYTSTEKYEHYKNIKVVNVRITGAGFNRGTNQNIIYDILDNTNLGETFIKEWNWTE